MDQITSPICVPSPFWLPFLSLTLTSCLFLPSYRFDPLSLFESELKPHKGYQIKRTEFHTLNLFVSTLNKHLSLLVSSTTTQTKWSKIVVK